MKRLIITLASLCFFLGACSSTGSSPEVPVVGYASFSGTGSVYTDGNIVVAWGDCTGEAGVMIKSVWMPIVVPFMGTEDGIFVGNLKNKSEEIYSRGDAIPAFAARVLPPAVIQAEGFIFLSPAPYMGPGDTVPTKN